jgi:hypothetical protein
MIQYKIILTGFTNFVNSDISYVDVRALLFWGEVIHCGKVHFCDVKCVCPVENITFLFIVFL